MIQVTHVSKTFRSGRGVVKAITDVSMQIPAGCMVAIMGKSGSGKSTLLNCVGGIEKPDRGEIHCFGVPVHRLATGGLSRFQRRHLGFVFQRANLLSYLTVAENIGLALALNGVRGTARQDRIAALLDAIGLASAASALPHELSGGESQRVSVARAIAHRPKLLLADEPTASLDSVTGERVVQLMVDLAGQNGSTVLMVTHDRDLTRLVDKVIELRDGQVVEPGPYKVFREDI